MFFYKLSFQASDVQLIYITHTSFLRQRFSIATRPVNSGRAERVQALIQVTILRIDSLLWAKCNVFVEFCRKYRKYAMQAKVFKEILFVLSQLCLKYHLVSARLQAKFLPLIGQFIDETRRGTRDGVCPGREEVLVLFAMKNESGLSVLYFEISQTIRTRLNYFSTNRGQKFLFSCLLYLWS